MAQAESEQDHLLDDEVGEMHFFNATKEKR